MFEVLCPWALPSAPSEQVWELLPVLAALARASLCTVAIASCKHASAISLITVRLRRFIPVLINA